MNIFLLIMNFIFSFFGTLMTLILQIIAEFDL
jgi:hypothetical protein